MDTMFKLALPICLYFLAVAANPAINTSVKDLVNSETCTNCFQLNNGQYIPIVGLGTSRIGKSEADVIGPIKDAIDVGYQHIDTADFYQNEVAIGKALEELFKNGNTTRDKVFITTKVWSNHHTEELAFKSVQDSLKKLKLDYVDLVLIHWPFTFQSGSEYMPRAANGSLLPGDPSKENFELAYKGLEKAVKLNLTRSIGVSNFNVKQLEKLAKSATITPATNQVESSPLLVQSELLDYCTQKGIKLVAYSPLRRGDSTLLNNEELKKIATKYGKTVAQVVLRWQIQRGVVVIPKTSKRHRMIENKDLFNFALTEQEMTSINALNTNNRAVKFEGVEHLAEYPF